MGNNPLRELLNVPVGFVAVAMFAWIAAVAGLVYLIIII